MNGNVCDVMMKSESLINKASKWSRVQSNEQTMFFPLLRDLLGPEKRAINEWKKADSMLMSI